MKPESIDELEKHLGILISNQEIQEGLDTFIFSSEIYNKLSKLLSSNESKLRTFIECILTKWEISHKNKTSILYSLKKHKLISKLKFNLAPNVKSAIEELQLSPL